MFVRIPQDFFFEIKKFNKISSLPFLCVEVVMKWKAVRKFWRALNLINYLKFSKTKVFFFEK